jgi:hypothetical protein
MTVAIHVMVSGEESMMMLLQQLPSVLLQGGSVHHRQSAGDAKQPVTLTPFQCVGNVSKIEPCLLSADKRPHFS